jgi:predicted TIM-barrel fold metal-dependent hydrolase
MIPFVDAHIHLWDLNHIRYDWLSPPFSDDGPNGSVEPIARNYGVAQYREDLARWNVIGAVHVDAGAAAESALHETQWLDTLAAVDGLPTGFVAFAALNDPDVDALLAAQAAHPRVKGIRHIVNWHADPQRTYGPVDLTVDPQWQAGYGLLAKHGLSFEPYGHAGADRSGWPQRLAPGHEGARRAAPCRGQAVGHGLHPPRLDHGGHRAAGA